MKKILAILLALVMVMGMATSVFATSVTINNPHYDNTVDQKYEAFKILTVSIGGEDVNFAYQVNPVFKDIIMKALGMTGEANDAAIVAAIGKLDYEGMRHFAGELYDLIMAAGDTYKDALSGNYATWSGASTTLAEGYWLIADITDLDGEYLSNSVVMIDTVGKKEVTVNAKPDVLESHKETDDENDSLIDVAGSEDEYFAQEVVDYDIGDAVPYTLAAEIPSNATSYKYYSFVMRDYLSPGLTINDGSFEAYIGTAKRTIAKVGTPEAATADFIYELGTVEDYKNVKGTWTTIHVYPNKAYYTYELNTTSPETDDYVKVEPNKDKGGDYLQLFASTVPHASINSQNVYVKYTATLNEHAKIGEPGNPNYYDVKFSNDPDGDSFGVTPEDINIVLTYKLDVNKITKDKTPLAGADFDLYKFIPVYNVPNTNASSEIDAEDIEAAKPAAEKLLPSTVPANRFVYHHGAGAWGYYTPLDSIKSVDGDGDTFTFAGIDDGYYMLEETTVPDGYNGIQPIEFRVIADHVVNRNGETYIKSLDVRTKVVGEVEFTVNASGGSISTNVVNNTGTELPTTGGIGTTIFYILGSIMVLGAVVVLVTKRRMSAEG